MSGGIKVRVWAAALILGWSGMVAANPCEWFLVDGSDEAAWTELSLARIVPEADRAAYPELYRNLVRLIATDLIGVSPATRNSILSIIARAGPAGDGARRGAIANDWAWIDWSNGRLNFHFDAALDRSFALLVFIAHEFVHLRWDFTYDAKGPDRVVVRPVPHGMLHTYLSERRALGREYDLLRASFGPGAAIRLRARHVRAYGAFKKAHRGGQPSRAFTTEQDRLFANASVARQARWVHEVSRREFIAQALRGYREHHAEHQAIRFIDKYNGDGPTCPIEASRCIALVTRVNLDIQRARTARRGRAAAGEANPTRL